MSVDNSINMSNLRKDLDYSSEVNSCDSTKDGSSLHGDLISTCVNNDKTCNKSLIVELEKTKLVSTLLFTDYDCLIFYIIGCKFMFMALVALL